MSRANDDMADLVSRAALQARLELVVADLTRATERLSAILTEVADQDNGGDTDDGRGTEE